MVHIISHGDREWTYCTCGAKLPSLGEAVIRHLEENEQENDDGDNA